MHGNTINNQDISVHVEVSGSIAESLRKLGKRVTKEVMLEAVKAGASVTATAINMRIPVETGELKSNLAIEVKSTPKGAIATVGFLDPFAASIAFWVEHGHANRVAKTKMQQFFKAKHGDTIGHVPPHPFFHPGIDSSLQESSKAVMSVLHKALQPEAETSSPDKTEAA